MILLFDYISGINEKLKPLKDNGKIIDYKISLRVNNKVSVYVILEENYLHSEIKSILQLKDEFDLEILTTTDIQDDPFYKELFNQEGSLILNSRKRLSNLLEEDTGFDAKLNTNIITFYSYKGGVGRSTTLASCASYLSNHYSKKVLILDCDLEAPGFTNYFLEEPTSIIHQKGVVEYFMDMDFPGDKVDIIDYLWEVGKDFSGDGVITVMPAGNLDDRKIEDELFGSHKNHYLEGLARIDMSSKYVMTNKFSKLISNAIAEIEPDVILIDSRTGFNDMFGITALNFSDISIGLFGNNAQSLPGLNYFMDRILTSKRVINSILINSILTRRSSFKRFEDYIESYIQNADLEDENIVIKSFPITRNTPLEVLGTNEEVKEDFIDLIKNKRFPEYNELFDHINDLLIDYSTIEDEFEDEEEEIQQPKSSEASYKQKISEEADHLLNLPLIDAHKLISETNRKRNNVVQKEFKHRIISNLRENWPKLYGEQFTPAMIDQIFYRRSMEDIFNHNKLIILGNKGTGKTFLYEALKFPDVVEKIQSKSQKKGNYEFFHIIDKDAKKFIDTNLFEDQNIPNSENFYHRFWIIYVWNAIMLEASSRLGYASKLIVEPIKNDTITRNRFIEIINNDTKFIEVENDLDKLNSFLKKSPKQQHLIIIFDGLDQVVKPINWHYKIVPLINYWRNNPFTRISPKLFVRSDLFEKLSNITNVKELKNQAISIEWNREELFGYFFKLVLTTSKEEFLRYMSFADYVSYEAIKQIKQKAGDENQITSGPEDIKFMIMLFFGKYASTDNTPKYGESYDWFYRNLKNANDTISLRPFIDLIDNALQYASENDHSVFPILPAQYFVHGEARKVAVGNHFDDLVSEKGNEELRIIFNYIRENKSTEPVYLKMSKTSMEKLLVEIIEMNNLDHTSTDSLIDLLKVNGIVGENFMSNGIYYSFALLYKYYLGLKNNPKRNSKWSR